MSNPPDIPKRGRGRPRKTEEKAKTTGGKVPRISADTVAARKRGPPNRFSPEEASLAGPSSKKPRKKPAQKDKRTTDSSSTSSKKKKDDVSHQELRIDHPKSNFPEPRKKRATNKTEAMNMIQKYGTNEHQEQIYGLQKSVDPKTFCIACENKSVTSFKFMYPEYKYTPVMVDNVSKEELDALVEKITSSFYIKKEVLNTNTNVAEDMFYALNDLETELDKTAFQKKISKMQFGRTPFKTWFYNQDKKRIKCFQVDREEAVQMTQVFKKTDKDGDKSSKRYQSTHFYYQNNPNFHTKGFGDTLRKITDTVLDAAKSVDPEFCAIIGSILVSLPGDTDQAFHLDDVRTPPKDDMLSCIISLSPGSKLNVAKSYNYRGKRQNYKTLELHQGSGCMFSGKTIHGGCGYPDEMNVRFHAYITKEENGPTWDVFSNDMRQFHLYCTYCNHHTRNTSSGRQAMERHVKTCKKKGNEQDDTEPIIETLEWPVNTKENPKNKGSVEDTKEKPKDKGSVEVSKEKTKDKCKSSGDEKSDDSEYQYSGSDDEDGKMDEALERAIQISTEEANMQRALERSKKDATKNTDDQKIAAKTGDRERDHVARMSRNTADLNQEMLERTLEESKNDTLLRTPTRARQFSATKHAEKMSRISDDINQTMLDRALEESKNDTTTEVPDRLRNCLHILATRSDIPEELYPDTPAHDHPINFNIPADLQEKISAMEDSEQKKKLQRTAERMYRTELPERLKNYLSTPPKEDSEKKKRIRNLAFKMYGMNKPSRKPEQSEEDWEMGVYSELLKKMDARGVLPGGHYDYLESVKKIHKWIKHKCGNNHDDSELLTTVFDALYDKFEEMTGEFDPVFKDSEKALIQGLNLSWDYITKNLLVKVLKEDELIIHEIMGYLERNGMLDDEWKKYDFDASIKKIISFMKYPGTGIIPVADKRKDLRDALLKVVTQPFLLTDEGQVENLTANLTFELIKSNMVCLEESWGDHYYESLKKTLELSFRDASEGELKATLEIVKQHLEHGRNYDQSHDYEKSVLFGVHRMLPDLVFRYEGKDFYEIIASLQDTYSNMNNIPWNEIFDKPALGFGKIKYIHLVESLLPKRDAGESLDLRFAKVMDESFKEEMSEVLEKIEMEKSAAKHGK